MSLRRGADHINRSASSGPRKGGRYSWIRWQDGESLVLRFITDLDDIITVNQHQQVPCADGVKRSFICQKEFGATCELCDTDEEWNYPRERGYGLAVVRVDEKDSNGRTVKTVDDLRVDEEGNKVPNVGIIAQGNRNFWSVIAGYHDRYGSLKKRDWEIQRRGATTDTLYYVFNRDADPILDMTERYGEYTPDLEELLTRMGSAEYYDLHLRGIGKEDKQEKQPSELDDLNKRNKELSGSLVSGKYE